MTFSSTSHGSADLLEVRRHALPFGRRTQLTIVNSELGYLVSISFFDLNALIDFFQIEAEGSVKLYEHRSDSSTASYVIVRGSFEEVSLFHDYMVSRLR